MIKIDIVDDKIEFSVNWEQDWDKEKLARVLVAIMLGEFNETFMAAIVNYAEQINDPLVIKHIQQILQRNLKEKNLPIEPLVGPINAIRHISTMYQGGMNV